MSNLQPTVIGDMSPLNRNDSQKNTEPNSTTALSTAEAKSNSSSTIVSTTANPTTITIVARPLPALTTVQQNNNNNHKIEQSNHLPHLANDPVYPKMKSKRISKIMTQILVDLGMVCCVALPTLILSLWGEPRESGFFCNDESLKHPYKDSTIRSWMLYLVCLALPVALITIIEFYTSNDKKLRNYNYSSNGYYLCHLALPDWLIESYKKIGILIFGCCVELSTIEIAKYSLGRLRPHFFMMCQPVLSDGTTCEDAVNAHRYIVNYTCSGRDDTRRLLRDVNLSFPSGHASFTCFTMLYITIYLQRRMQWKRIKMLKHLMQFLFLMFAWYTALTRVSDYKHHWTDVLAGSGIGITYAIIATSTLW